MLSAMFIYLLVFQIRGGPLFTVLSVLILPALVTAAEPRHLTVLQPAA
jgi:hypothetical protein